MILYEEHILSNGLRVLAHRDAASRLAAVNLLYMVGSANESPNRTGLAHLFEHLMFRGTRLVPDFDRPVQAACGENNAFTNSDYTDYYMTLPMDNVETALWLEADRMTGLDLDPCKVDVEKMVVVEEMKQRYLNQPYGEQWILVRDMVYKNHHYRWPTIGLSPDHIEGTTMEEVRDFYGRYYTPSNAILSVAADIAPERVFELAEKWFGGIASSPRPHDVWTPEPEQTAARRTEIERPVPATQLTIAFPMAGRRSREYYVADVITDLLAGGTSSRLTRSLIKENKIFSAANAYITGELDPGMMVVTGQLMPGVSLALAEEALWAELEMLISEDVEELELEKVRNKFEANITFGELNVMNKALNLAYYAMWDGLAQMNGEAAIYRSVSVEEIKSVADRLFARKKSNTLVIHAENTSKGLKGVD